MIFLLNMWYVSSFIIITLYALMYAPQLVHAQLAGPPPASGKQFTVLPPGSTLPSGAECASRIRRTTWEPRPDNADENQYVPVEGTDYAIPRYSGTDMGIYLPGHAERANVFIDRVDGNFTGTTDEIIQWAACKWGFDEDVARAQAVVESFWEMSANGDGGLSWGLLQIKETAFTGTHPASATSTAFNADFTYARWRLCYEGLVDYLAEGGTGYAAGDDWGCIGTWYTGNWYGPGGTGRLTSAQEYIAEVQGELAERKWDGWSGTQVTIAPTIGVDPTATPSTGCGLAGDIDCSGEVNLFDLSQLLGAFGSSDTAADIDGSGEVNVFDLGILLRNFGK